MILHSLVTTGAAAVVSRVCRPNEAPIRSVVPGWTGARLKSTAA
jgi:hypothetical protein